MEDPAGVVGPCPRLRSGGWRDATLFRYNPGKERLTMATDAATTKSWVQKTPNVCGGDACIRNTRITAYGLVHYRQLGLSDQRILEAIQGLTQNDLDTAWEYYAGHTEEIDRAIRLNEEA